jgi:stage II sporulation protein E
MDLTEIQLDTGRASVYKWGAAPSYLIRENEAEKIGTATPPPGLSVTDGRETVERLSLRRGEVLIMVSDGVAGEEALRRIGRISAQPPGELAAKILQYGAQGAEDDATVAAVTLLPGTTPI